MDLAPGSKLGPYVIEAPLGAGGMGIVYRAHDPRLGRHVAIKLAAERFSDRFEREARTIAALNHSHICTLHDVGPNYLVMELVEGPTLAERIAQGPIAPAEALRIALQVASALDAAHACGIVHRDLKPSNVKITPQGAVKVLDFGLAKHGEPADDSSTERSPTVLALTNAGMVLGTATYMAPEQARGQAVDRRADIWAFGVVLYEMLTGGPPFEGDTVSDILALVLTSDPAWERVPAHLQPLLRRCLVKDPARRLRDIGDVDLLLQDGPNAPSARRSWVPWIVAAGLLLLLGAVATVHWLEQVPVSPPMRFQIPATVDLAESGNLGLSPDGRHLAFLAVGGDGLVRLWLRDLQSLEARPLLGSETAANAPPFFWSPDSRFIAFDAGGKLKKLNVAGGPPEALADLAGMAIGGAWNRQGDIVIGGFDGIGRIPEGGGAVTAVTTVDAATKENGHFLPTFLGDERHFVYVRTPRAAPDAGGIYLGSIDLKPEQQSAQRLLPYAQGLAYVPPRDGSVGRLLFVREGTLLVQPFDERRLELAGPAMPIAEQVGAYLDTAFFAAHPDILVYRTADPPFPITWVDRQGNTVGRLSEPGHYTSAALSPDGKRVVAALTDPRDQAQGDLWLFDLARTGGPARFTSAAGFKAEYPIWSPNGARVAFRLGGPAATGMYEKAVETEPREPTPLPITRRGLTRPTSWSQDGRFLMYAHTDAATGWDLWVLPTGSLSPAADLKAIPFARTRFNEEQGQFSPDGRWVAYVSNESGTNEVYLRAFAVDQRDESTSGAAVLVSRAGGGSPHWRRDGKELFYLAATDQIMSVTVTSSPTLRVDAPSPLFQAPHGTLVGDVTADGQRFLLLKSEAAPFTVVLNWMR